MPDPEEKGLYLYVTTPLDKGGRKFFLHDLNGEEQLSGLFHYRLNLRTSDNAIAFPKIVGKNITVTIELRNGTKRHINGVVSNFVQAENDRNFTSYHAEIRPWLWQLTLTSNSKIYQNQTVPQIITAVFSDLGFRDFSDRTTGTYAMREYCVQYQETAFDFVSRLMEDEGIFYFFEHAKDSHTLVFADDADAHKRCPGLSAARIRKASADWEEDDVIDRCSLEQQMIPNKYAVRDFNFETPDTGLLSRAEGKASGNLGIYEYPGGFMKKNQGDALANRRLEAHELPQKTFRGEGFCRAFMAGYRFNVKDHDRKDMNGSFVLRSLTIQATPERYVNTFEAFPVQAPFRPPLETEKPKILGTQTAIVVGKKGDEIFTDKYGRVKVQFHWDQDGKKDEKSSCWVRVAQVWAGKGWGTLFTPRVGTEVIVSFLEGDPDRPIIIGTVYNARQCSISIQLKR